MDDLVWEEQPVLLDPAAIIAFEGWGDAGGSASGVAETLMDQLAGYRFAHIDAERFFDFQVVRPIVELDEQGMREIEWPDTEFHALATTERDIVLITGVEPHARWKSYCRAVVEGLRRAGINQVVTLGAFIGEVAHSLPVPLIGVTNQPELLDRYQLLASGYEGPTGIIGVLNVALAEAGFSVISVWAAVPHYLTSQEYPPGALALLDKTADILGLALDRSELVQMAESFRAEVDEAISDPEMRSYVSDLEIQGLADETGTGPAERLVNEIERFLRES